MKSIIRKAQDHGKEAFAYLAVILLTLTTFYVSYQVSLEREMDNRIRNEALLSDMRIDMDSANQLVKVDLISLHDKLLIEAEEKVHANPSSSRLDHVLEGLLTDRLQLGMSDLLTSSFPENGIYSIQLLNWSVNCQPILGSIEVPAPATDEKDQVSGFSSIANGSALIGVNSTFHYQIEVQNVERGFHLRKETTVEVQRNSLSDILSRRLDRFQTSLEDGELAGLMEYIVSSLAQMKCVMGYGRSPGEGEIVPLSLLSKEELMSCLDLALLLFSQSYMRATDTQLLSKVENGFGMSPGAGGDIPLEELIMNTSIPLDPSMVPLIGEGLFHEDNPPSLEMMLRPLFYSITDFIVNKLISYAGLDKAMLMMVGGLKTVFDMGVKAANAISTTLFGKKVIESGQETASSMFRGMLKKSVYLDPSENNIFIRDVDGMIWNGSRIDGYPEVSIPDLQRTYEIGLSDGSDEDLFYRAPNGTIHPKSDYYDETEEFYGARCNVYSVEAVYSFLPIEPPFGSKNLMDDPEFISSLALFLGSERGDEGGDIESKLMERGKLAIRKVTDELFHDLTAGGNEEWEDMWVGWSTSDPPPMSYGLPPIRSMVEFQAQPIMELAVSFASSLIEELDASDFLSALAGVEQHYKEHISDWISMNYDQWVDKDDQMMRCRQERTNLLLDNSHVSDIEITLLGEDIILTDGYYTYGKENLDFIHNTPLVSKQMGLGLDPDMDIDNELLSYWTSGISSSFSEVKTREFNDGSDGRPLGWIWNELNGPSHRGGSLIFTFLESDKLNLAGEVENLLLKGLNEVGDHFEKDRDLTGGRFLVPPPPKPEEILKVQGHSLDRSEFTLDNDVSIWRSPAFSVSMDPVSGTYNTDPLNGSPPYVTKYRITLRGEVSVDYSISSNSSMGDGSISRSMDIDLTLPLQVRSNWAMFGIEYDKIGTLWDQIGDILEEAKNLLKRELNRIVENLLGDSMASLREVPPLVVDLVKGKDLDLFEIGRVFSNVTMDLSLLLRDTVQWAINKIIDIGANGVLNAICNLLSIEEIDLKLNIGAFSLELYTERSALKGGEGTLFRLSLNIFPIGMHCYMSLDRIGNGSYDFNGKVTFDIGPLYLVLEVDPFMNHSPHMISMGARLEAFGGKVFRASFEIPALEEYRSCEISIGDTLGVEPFVPIPMLGIQAVFNAGFRLNYRTAEELEPHINEVNISYGNISDVEIYNPRLYSLHGAMIEIEDPTEGFIASWRLEPECERYTLSGINGSNLQRWEGSIPSDGIVRVILRSPSGIILDDFEVDLFRNAWISREADGFGIWEYGEGSPGCQNGGSTPGDIRSFLISIALSSIKEAWAFAYDTCGISFDLVTHFMEKAIDLFMERFLSVARELVIDARMFMILEFEDASGTAGGGMELSFQADGEAVAEFLGWLYHNIRELINNIADPHSAGNYHSFPREILSRCFIGLDIFFEIEMPTSIEKMAPDGVDLPLSFMLAITAKVNLAVPMKLMGKNVGGGYISLGVYVRDAPGAIVSLFYDIRNDGLQKDLYLLRVAIWEES